MSPEITEKFILANELFSVKGYPSPVNEIEIDGKKIYVKLDDQLYLKCSKQRSIPLMIYEHMKIGANKFVVSSSGNAALVSAFCAMKSQANFELEVYLSNYISDAKLSHIFNILEISKEKNNLRANKVLKIGKVTFFLSEDPKQKAFQKAREDSFVNLRGSTDDYAIEGFASITDELNKQIGSDIDAVFVAASSGTTAIGIEKGFQYFNQNPQIHIVQTSKVNALVKDLANESEKEDSHPSESIVDIVAHRKDQVHEIIKNSNGQGWIISIDEALQAKQKFAALGIETSYDSALSLAAYLKSAKNFKKPVLICTG